VSKRRRRKPKGPSDVERIRIAMESISDHLRGIRVSASDQAGSLMQIECLYRAELARVPQRIDFYGVETALYRIAETLRPRPRLTDRIRLWWQNFRWQRMAKKNEEQSQAMRDAVMKATPESNRWLPRW
jgi:hypothetical protein